MLTKSQIKLISSLKQKKFRIQHQLFVVEGVKVVQDFLNSDYELVEIFAVDDHFSQYKQKLTRVNAKELSKISGFNTPNKVVATFKIPRPKPINWSALVVALDAVNDPGNLGTIIRLCDWFGIENLICSETTVECFNPKVVQASMGSHTRVNITYMDLEKALPLAPNCMGTFMDGMSIYEQNLPDEGLLVLGNEANGISQDIEALVDTRLSIPRFGNLKQTESLNVANAAAILLSEFKRKLTET
ncbi:MAG: RNA methyltransferase [Flavobacteriaceae bacterium]|jgi:TrmH family RNA methyltransferase|nr:RNA methyltransferase [Flavobacteriaceae bacterium]